MTTVYKYKIYCNTDSVWETKWDTESLTVCPTNSSHSVNSNSVTIIDSISENETIIKEETIKTGGHYRVETKKIIASQGVNSADYTWPYPISVLSVNFKTNDSHKNDLIDNIIIPDTTVGNITADVSVGETVITVSQSVIDNIALGYGISLDDGVNNNDLGKVSNIDKNTNQITVETATTNSFLSSTPTMIKMCIYMFDKFEISEAGSYSIGSAKIGGSYLPAGKVSRVVYTNNTAETKEIIFAIEYLY